MSAFGQSIPVPPVQPAAPLPIEVPPVNLAFADDLRADRLATLARGALAVVGLIFWGIIAVSVIQRTPLVAAVFVPLIVLCGGAFLALGFAKRARVRSASWSLLLGVLGAIGACIALAAPGSVDVLIFTLPVVVFIVGLVSRPRDTLYAAFLSTLVMIGAPTLAHAGTGWFDGDAVIGLLLLGASATISILFTRDLYQITDWAMYNYGRERRLANELFENREALEKSLLRAQVLADDLKKANVEIEAARHSAEEAKRFRGQFLANMSHELRTPLNAIIGFSETMLRFPMMYDDVPLPQAYYADMEQIFSSGRQLLTLINDILDLSKVDAGKLEVRAERVDLAPLIEHVVATTGGLIGTKQIALTTELPAEMPAVFGDRARVAQVLLNLYSNAAKFTNAGHIHVRAEIETQGAHKGVHLRITDTGIGIAPHDLETIFEEFRQADTEHRDPRQGSGLGLAISRQLMTLMRGRIWAESKPGVGSTFHLYFRVWEEETAALPEAMATA
jgi:signal transduction histidine kinase